MIFGGGLGSFLGGFISDRCVYVCVGRVGVHGGGLGSFLGRFVYQTGLCRCVCVWGGGRCNAVLCVLWFLFHV